MSDLAIGVFDSGVGGLTAVKELNNILPNENIIYFEIQQDPVEVGARIQY